MLRRAVFKVRFLLLVFVATLAGVWPMAAQAAVGLAGFTVLSAAPNSGGAVTCTRSTVNGDVGSTGQAAAVVQTGCSITGAITAPVSTQVFDDFNRAYSALAGVPCQHFLTTLDLTQSLPPGVYCFTAAATATNQVLTLNGPANGTWLFKIGTGGTGALTGTNLQVLMAGGGQPCNVNWWVAEAASLTVNNGSPTPFQGTILAGAAITLVGTSGAPAALTVTGRLWAKAAVSMTDSTIVGCTSPITVPGQGCKEGTGNDGDEDNDRAGGDRHESVKSAKHAKHGDHERGKHREHGDDDRDHHAKNCDSDDSNNGNDDRSDD